MRKRSSNQSDERGIALVMVIWVLALLSLMAAGFVAEARVELRRAGNLRGHAEAEALAEAGIHIAVAKVIAEQGSTHPQRWTERLAGGSVTLTLVDERGKIDLNEAESALLASLFESQGLSSSDASALAAAVADFRDADHASEPVGAEDAAYPAQSGGAKDARFEAIDELLQVKGMTPALYARIAQLVTVYSAMPGVDPLAAEPAVLAAIPHIDRAELARFLALRARLAPILKAVATGEFAGRLALSQRREQAIAQLQAAVPKRNSAERFLLISPFAPPTFTILAEAVTVGEARFRRAAVLRIPEDPLQPHQILAWRRPRPLD